MALPIKGSFLLAHYDVQYRWCIRSIGTHTELSIEKTEFHDGQLLVVRCPKVFNPDFVVQAIDQALVFGWTGSSTGNKQKDYHCIISQKGRLRLPDAE